MVEYLGYYALAALIVFLIAFNHLKNYNSEKRVKGSLILSVWWPVTVALIIGMLLENLADYIKYGGRR